MLTRQIELPFSVDPSSVIAALKPGESLQLYLPYRPFRVAAEDWYGPAGSGVAISLSEHHKCDRSDLMPLIGFEERGR